MEDNVHFFQHLLVFPFFKEQKENQHKVIVHNLINFQSDLINFQTEGSSCITFYLMHLPFFIPLCLSLPIKKKFKTHT